MVRMRAFRLFILLAVMISLPGYGFAAFAQRTCQEQMAASDHVSVAGDCCPGKNDQGTACRKAGESPLGKQGGCSACKAGFNCKSPQSFEPTEALRLPASSGAHSTSLDPPVLLLSRSPNGLWRPPRLI
jgi:hypothetical protein